MQNNVLSRWDRKKWDGYNVLHVTLTSAHQVDTRSLLSSFLLKWRPHRRRSAALYPSNGVVLWVFVPHYANLTMGCISSLQGGAALRALNVACFFTKDPFRLLILHWMEWCVKHTFCHVACFRYLTRILCSMICAFLHFLFKTFVCFKNCDVMIFTRKH
jgi:hypothetical protein